MQLNTIRAALRKRVVVFPPEPVGPRGSAQCLCYESFAQRSHVSFLESAGPSLPVTPALFPLLLLVFKASSLLPDVNIPCLLFARVVTLSLAALHCS